jgi:hypothetical protein
MGKRITGEERICRNLEKERKSEQRRIQIEENKSRKLLDYIDRKYNDFLEEKRKKEKEESDFIQTLKDKANFEYQKVLHFCKKINNYDTEFKPVIDSLKPTMQNILQHEGKSFIILKALGSISDSGYDGIKKITSEPSIRNSVFEEMTGSNKTYNFSSSLSDKYDINLSKEEMSVSWRKRNISRARCYVVS